MPSILFFFGLILHTLYSLVCFSGIPPKSGLIFWQLTDLLEKRSGETAIPCLTFVYKQSGNLTHYNLELHLYLFTPLCSLLASGTHFLCPHQFRRWRVLLKFNHELVNQFVLSTWSKEIKYPISSFSSLESQAAQLTGKVKWHRTGQKSKLKLPTKSARLSHWPLSVARLTECVTSDL